MEKEHNAYIDWLKTIFLALLIVIIVRQFLFSNYIVQGESMMPTIHEGNRLIVNKIEYEFSEPDRFDLIVFHANSDEDYIKRVIGLPGETVEYANDQLYINGEALDEPYLNEYKNMLFDAQLTEDFTLLDKTGKARVPEGNLFVMGDNRRHSYDSRHIGFISMDQVVGVVDVRYWPLESIQFNF